jgi:hypothetical protein
MELNLAKLVIEVKPARVSLVAPLVAGRGAAFEDAVHHVCCTRSGVSCVCCSSYRFCPVSSLTAKEISQNPDVVRRHQKPALPYVFTKECYGSLPTNSIGLTLIGPACSYVSTILSALEVLLGGKSCFSGITALDYQDTPLALGVTDFTAISTLPVLSASELLALHHHRYTGCRSVRILLKTPVRIVRDGRELNRFDPVVFCRSIVRRISALTAYYGETGADHDLFRYLIESAGAVQLLKVLDYPKHTTGSLRGVTGCYDVSGPFEELGPMLDLGSLLHVGKRASYGFGAFEVAPIS